MPDRSLAAEQPSERAGVSRDGQRLRTQRGFADVGAIASGDRRQRGRKTLAPHRRAPVLSAYLMGVDMKPNTQAFSLLELVVALAIAATLAAFAVPSYRNHIAKAHRTD